MYLADLIALDGLQIPQRHRAFATVRVRDQSHDVQRCHSFGPGVLMSAPLASSTPKVEMSLSMTAQ